MRLEPALAAVVMLIGIGLTSAGVFAHEFLARAIAPGALLTFVGSGWLGNALARRSARLIPGSQIVNLDG